MYLVQVILVPLKYYTVSQLLYTSRSRFASDITLIHEFDLISSNWPETFENFRGVCLSLSPSAKQATSCGMLDVTCTCTLLSEFQTRSLSEGSDAHAHSFATWAERFPALFSQAATKQMQGWILQRNICKLQRNISRQCCPDVLHVVFTSSEFMQATTPSWPIPHIHVTTTMHDQKKKTVIEELKPKRINYTVF